MKKLFLSFLILILCLNSVLLKELEAESSSPDLQKILEEFDTYVKKTQKQWNVPGMSICIVVGDEVVYKKSFGIRQVNKEDKVNNRTIFQIASCTKAFTTALVAMLVDGGYLSWQDKVIKYLPDFRLENKKISDEMTIEDLLAQYSGLPSYSQHLMMLFRYDSNYIIESMRYIKQTGSFRKSFSYQNNLYLVMGEIIKKATGKSWEYNIKKYIFNPLAMDSSSTDYKSYLKSKNRALGHYYAGGKLKALSDNLPYNGWPYTFAAASGINSNIDDMSQWLLFLVNDASSFGWHLISKENYDKLFEGRVFISNSTDNKKSYYCLGWKSMEYEPENIMWHAGTTDGEGAYISFMRDNKIGISILMNLPNGRMADALAKKFYDSYLQNPEVNWSAIKLDEANRSHKKRMQKAPPEIVIPPMELKKYVGIYNNVLYGDAEIKLDGEMLKFSAGPRKVWVTLKHYSGNSFDGIGIPGWRFKRPMFAFKVYENSNIRGLIVEDMTDGTDPMFRKIK
ncbi:MAG: serine hydrolase [Endomicrobium sp.]|jgi:CubicO group peptidase (beta-lactamase class C family)|nr:serine hydrolase [Endomicrobium sp.]